MPDLTGIGTVISRILEVIKDAFLWIYAQMMRLLRYFWQFMTTKPEWGLTSVLLMIYLMT